MSDPLPIAEPLEAILERLEKKAAEPITPADRERMAKTAMESGKRLHDERVRTILRDAKVPKRHLQAAVEQAPEWRAEEARLVAKLGSGFMIALVGGRGTGKTQIGVELMRRLAQDYRVSRYCTAFEFFMEVKAGYNEAGDTEKEVIKSFQSPVLLVIDELGKRSETEWENRLLYELLNRRYNDMKDTLIISNQDAASLESALGDSLVSRMRETGGIIDCQWESFRK